MLIVPQEELNLRELPHSPCCNLLHLLLTGRVCVPIDHQRPEDFDPFAVPTIRFVFILN